MGNSHSDKNDLEGLQRQIAELSAQLVAARKNPLGESSVSAQGRSETLGERSAKVNGDNSGTIITGTQIVSHYHGAGRTSLTKEEIAKQVAGYLRWLRARTESIELRGIERSGGSPVVILPLESAYVSLHAKPMLRMGEAAIGKTAEHQPSGDHVNNSAKPVIGEYEVTRKWESDKQYKYTGENLGDIDLSQILGLGNRLVITGGPGCGKTTVLLHMAWSLACSLLTGKAEPAKSRLGLKIPPQDLPLPLLVPLASFARYRSKLPDNAPAESKTLAHFISHNLISKQANLDLPADFFVQLIRDGRNVVLLLDGLDEVANEYERAEVRQSIEELVSGRDAMRVIATCRTIAYRGTRTALGANFREFSVQPLDLEKHIAPMVKQAYECIFPYETKLSAEHTNKLLEEIHALEKDRRARLGDDAVAFVDSPLMVRLLLIVRVNNRTLPNERADLFDKAINALLQVDYGREESDIRALSADWKLFRDMAQHLALYMHKQGSDQGREIDERMLVAALYEEPEFRPYIDAFLSHARQRGSVLEERDGTYRFIHLAFQEFLVARYLREVIGSEGREAIVAFLEGRLDDSWWREPILLLAGYMAANAAKSARDFASALAKAGKEPSAQFHAAELASAAVLEWRKSGEAIRKECTQRLVALLNNTSVLEKVQSNVRTRAGGCLAQLGDSRFDPNRFYLSADDMLGFEFIPADQNFKIGTRKADVKRKEDVLPFSVPSDEINDAITPTHDFYIARYLVTVAQFRAFFNSAPLEFGLDFVPLDLQHHSLRNLDTFPVVSVTLHDAQLYCIWLNNVLKTSHAVSDCKVAQMVRSGQWCVHLPSELEWEKAARGNMKDAIFPWGDKPNKDWANCHENGLQERSVVGCFPPNDFGLYDMIGNVWERTESYYGHSSVRMWNYSEYRADHHEIQSLATHDENTTIRGGSWREDMTIARCAYRGVYRSPYERRDCVGFRLVLRPSPIR